MDKRCRKCPARCCRYFAVPIGQPDTFDDFEQVRWYMLHRGVRAYVDVDGEWYLVVENRCLNLRKKPAQAETGSPAAGKDRSGEKLPGDELMCRDYRNRPGVCREFSPRTCEFTRGGAAVQEMFATAAELEAYARRMLGLDSPLPRRRPTSGSKTIRPQGRRGH